MQLTMTKRFEYKDLPDMASIFHEAEKIAGRISVGKTLFFEKYGVSSEWEYKIAAMRNGTICKHSHIGWNSWDETARNVEYIYRELERRNSYITRMGFIFDWVMGVPAEYRRNMQRGTGLIFETPDEWRELGRIAPIQPHLSDHMIGAPNALENTVLGLQAGVTSIGNVSHYFTYEYPGIELERERTVNSLVAFALMGKIPGTIIHSNLDDGYGNQMHDLANLVGWAMIERYLVEGLLGACMTFSYGNLFSDPVSRIVFNMAMDAGNTKGVPGTMTFGNTIDYGLDLSRNYGALSSFSLADAVCQRHKPTGHAVSAVPVSEAQRIPTPDEIVDAHLCIDMMIEKSQLLEPYMNWSAIEARRDVLVACGSVFFERVMNGLDDLGVDTRHAGEVFACLKSIGAAQLEEKFGVLLSTVGMDPISSELRFTFGFMSVASGIDMLPFIIGLFPLSEVFHRIYEIYTLPDYVIIQCHKIRFPSLREWFARKWVTLRSAVIGTFIGILPGTGASPAAFISYSMAREASSHPEDFGKGAVEGVIAPEASHNAVTGGAMVPTLALGIPGDAETTLILATLTIHQITPGVRLMLDNPVMVHSIFFLLLIAYIMLTVAAIIMVRSFGRLIRLPNAVLLGLIIVFSMLGAFIARNNYFDLLIALAVGLVAFGFRLGNFPLAPALVSFILAPQFEYRYSQVAIYRADTPWPVYLADHPLACIFLVVVLFLLIRPVVKSVRKWREVLSHHNAP